MLLLLPPSADASLSQNLVPRSLDGSDNNVLHPSWGQVSQSYQRFAPPNYADGVGTMVSGPNPRYISNRVFNSLGVDLFSERNVSQLAWVWGQSLDHTFGDALSGTEEADIAFDSSDPLEGFTDPVTVRRYLSAHALAADRTEHRCSAAGTQRVLRPTSGPSDAPHMRVMASVCPSHITDGDYAAGWD
jgi:hypothetical protein